MSEEELAAEIEKQRTLNAARGWVLVLASTFTIYPTSGKVIPTKVACRIVHRTSSGCREDGF
jgi:hypothetical protein